jgi:three-Cys-motif partner protein
MGKRKNNDRWPELCDRVTVDDGLPCREAGAWTEDKLFYWNRYIEITTKAMVGKTHWAGGIVYVDLFGGPGVCKLRESGKRIPGSALLAAWAPKPFTRILICEKDPRIADACRQRLNAIDASQRITIFEGDCNSEIHSMVAEIPDRALTLAFVDPEGLHVHFETLQMLTRDRRADLLVLFADRMDIVRNVELYARQESSKLDRFLGPETQWRDKWKNLPHHDASHVCKLFTEIYKDRLMARLGYLAQTDQVMRSSKSSLYRVIYASKHPLGLKFWQEISKIDQSGQMDLHFSD